MTHISPPPPAGLRSLAHIAGDRGWPLLGTTIPQLRDLLGFTRDQVNRHGPVHRVSSFGLHGVVVCDVEQIRIVLNNSGPLVSSQQGWWPYLGQLMPGGLMLMDGMAHRLDRKLLASAFRPQAMAHHTRELSLRVPLALEQWPTGVRRPVLPALKQLTFDLANALFLGLDPGPKSQEVSDAFSDMVAGSVSVLRVAVPGSTWGRALAGRSRLEAYLGERVRWRREHPGVDLLGLLCDAKDEQGEGFDDDRIVEHLAFFMMAAHDTTTGALTSMMYQLARHPDWQRRLREQLGPSPSTEEVLANADLGHAISEALRLQPPLPSIVRRAVQDFELGGVEIPNNSMVNLSVLMAHHDERYWPDPERFRPERFDPASPDPGVGARAWMPYGAGAHACLGRRFGDMEIRLVVAALLSRFQWQLEPGYEPRFDSLPFSRPIDGLMLKLETL